MASFTDDFNRADSTSLGAGWVEVSGDWSIVSNQLSPGALGGTIILRAATAMSSNDNSAQVTIAATTAASQGVWCRGNTNISNGYLWRNNGTSWDLFSVVGGSFTSIGTYAAAAAPGDVAKVEAVGSAIKGYVNGVAQVSVTDTSVTTGTNVGLRSESVSGLRYDDFAAADVGSGVTGSAAGAFGGLTGTASGVRSVTATAGAAFGGMSGAATGTRTVVGAAAFTGGAMTGHATGVVSGGTDGSGVFVYASDEVVAKAWIAQIQGFTSAMVGEQLPRSTDGWATSGYVTVALAGGTTVPEYRLESPVIMVQGWAVTPGYDRPPWEKARNLVLAIQAGTYSYQPWFLELPGCSEDAVVKTAYAIGKPRRTYGDFGDYAVYTLDLVLNWVPVAKSTP